MRLFIWLAAAWTKGAVVMRMLVLSLVLFSIFTGHPAGAHGKNDAPLDVEKTLQRPDLVLRYRDFGSGEPILLLMGGPGVSAEGLAPVGRTIAKRARAIVPDQRGSGMSIPEKTESVTLGATLADLEALRGALGIEKWTVWGCSWGGMLALDYASKYPDSIKGLVLVGAGGTSWASFEKPFFDNMLARMTSDERAAQRFWSQPEVIAEDPSRAAVEGIRAILPSQFFDRSKAYEAISLFRAGREYYNPEAGTFLIPEFEKGAAARVKALGELRIPALIIHGRQDPMPESVALANHALLKGSRLVWLDRCGHWPWIEQPAEFETALFDFLFPD